MRRVARGELGRGVWFNVLGLFDLAAALTLGALTGLSTATQLIPVSPTSVQLTMLPLVLIVTSAVPLAVALHIMDLAALRRLSATRRGVTEECEPGGVRSTPRSVQADTPAAS